MRNSAGGGFHAAQSPGMGARLVLYRELGAEGKAPMRIFARHAVNIILAAALLLSLSHTRSVHAQDDPEKFIAKLIAQMTPEAKVGQLFIVAFPGTDTGIRSDIAELILNYHVGGVMLSTANGNILSTDTPTQVARLTMSLQDMVRAAANVPGERSTPFIPLFIALEQSGNGPPHTQLVQGMSPLPSAMALGATWKPDNAMAVGKLAGQELAAVGVNLLLGPSLDVLDPLRPTDVGVNAFGGDPYWVGVMSQSYVRGLRAGSQNRVAAVLLNFPGQAAAPDAEGVVNQSLEELKKVQLVPFLTMLQPAAGEQRALADALMTSHVRYRGFFGNIRERTGPISLDAQAIQALFALPELKAWREAGGVVVSGPLGASLVRRYYDQGLTPSIQKAAQDALQAGNDILLLADFTTGTWTEQFAAIKSVIQHFQEKYSSDLEFRKRVDDAVARILRLKVRLYPNFDPSAVIVNPLNVKVNDSPATTLAIAQEALTLLAPSAAALVSKPLTVPTSQDSIVIFTDDRPYKECPTCQARPLLATDAISQTIARLYPNKVDPARITSLSMGSLLTFLSGTSPGSPGPDVGAALSAATWVVFAVLDTDASVPQSSALKQLVIQRPALLTNKKVIILAFDVPYYLEPEVIAKASAVYALYGRTDPFVQVAVRALFGDIKPHGSPPVSVDAIGYQLITQTQPNPNQIIELFVGEAPKEPNATPTPVEIKVGDTLKVRTGTILDRNGHPVPDGTPVTFSRTFSQSVELPPLVAQTRNGVATISFVLDRIGPLRVRAMSEPAMTSFLLQLMVAEQPSQPILISPPTPTLQPTLTPTATPVPTPTPTPTPAPKVQAPGTSRRVEADDLLLALVGAVLVGGAGYWTQMTRPGSRRADTETISKAMRLGLWSVLAGLGGYVLYGLGAPGSDLVRAALGTLSAPAVVMAFGAVPVIADFGSRIVNRRA